MFIGTREQALVHAFSSAALLFEIGRYCAMNKIRYCSCGDENSPYHMSEYPPDLMAQQPYNGGALMYNPTASTGSMATNGMDTVATDAQRSSMTEGQPTVSRFYWAGCSDNLRVAREYASAFLGFQNKLVKLPKPFESLKENDLDLRRFARSVKKTTPQAVDQFDADNIDEDEEEANDDVEDDEIEEDEQAIDAMQLNRHRRFVTQAWWNKPNNQRKQPPLTSQSHRYSPMTYSNFPASYNPFGFRKQPQTPPLQSSQSATAHGRMNYPRRPRSRASKREASLIKALNRHNYLAGVVVSYWSVRVVIVPLNTSITAIELTFTV